MNPETLLYFPGLCRHVQILNTQPDISETEKQHLKHKLEGNTYISQLGDGVCLDSLIVLAQLGLDLVYAFCDVLGLHQSEQSTVNKTAQFISHCPSFGCSLSFYAIATVFLLY